MEEKQWTILIIEDDKGIADAISSVFQLRSPEINLISTDNGNEGLDIIKKDSPDLAILDLGLPDIDGFDVLKSIRSFSSIPVIICTGRSDTADVVKGADLGADDYIVKPFDPKVLLVRVSTQLRKIDYR